MHDLPYWIAGLIACGFLVHGLTDWFSSEGRLRRKRDKNHRRVTRKSSRAGVMLRLRLKKPKK